MGKLAGGLVPASIALLGAAALAGCSALYQQAVASIRQPGDHIATAPERVWLDFKCDERERPFVRVEWMEVVPETVRPGARVNYRLIYVMCPRKPSETIKTSLQRRLLFRGEQVAHNVNDAFELKPGRWVVDSFFTLPTNSPLGVYALEVHFKTPNGKAQTKARSFVVSNESYLSGPSAGSS
jgi:hypothetical protein